MIIFKWEVKLCQTCPLLNNNFRFIIRISPTEQSRWTEQIESRLGKRRTIDILLVNSALWDINRSGPWAHLDLRQNIEDFLSSIPLSVPNGLCFWLTTPPSKLIERVDTKHHTYLSAFSFRGDKLKGNDSPRSRAAEFPHEIQCNQCQQGEETHFGSYPLHKLFSDCGWDVPGQVISSHWLIFYDSVKNCWEEQRWHPLESKGKQVCNISNWKSRDRSTF